MFVCVYLELIFNLAGVGLWVQSADVVVNGSELTHCYLQSQQSAAAACTSRADRGSDTDMSVHLTRSQSVLCPVSPCLHVTLCLSIIIKLWEDNNELIFLLDKLSVCKTAKAN